MDVDIEKIHNILIEADLPSSINDLKNPTEDFVVNLMNTFLRRFQIDISAIDKPTIEQKDIMSYCEDCDIVGLINLHVAMVQICDRIFCKGLCITDITNPGTKKVRKQAKFLANFILYATNKESDIEDKISEIQNKAKILHDMLERKNEIFETINDKALHISKQLSTKEKYIAEIQKLQAKLEHSNNKYLELMPRVTAAEERKQQAVQLCGIYKTEALKLGKTIVELQSEVVKSPEEYHVRLKKLEQQQSSKVKEREMLEETYQDKKHLIERQKNILTFIQKQLDKFTVVKDAHGQLKKISEQEDVTRKQVDVCRADIAEFERRLESQRDQRKDVEVDDIHTQCEERLSPLRNMSVQLLNNKKALKEKLEDVQIQHNEDCLKLKKMQSEIKKVEEQTAVLIKNYQDVYDNEIETEKSLWKTWTSR